jgi:group I intron endonuclease
LGFIYKINLRKNNICYIGKTNRNINERYIEHIYDVNGYNNRKLYKELSEHNKKDFKIEIIEIINNEDSLNEREQYWINYYNTFKNGCNEIISLYKQNKTIEVIARLIERI